MPFIDTLLDLLVPDACLLCQQTQVRRQPHLLCPFCWAALPRNAISCRHCATPLATPGVCNTCQSNPLTQGQTVAALLHQGEARYLVHQLKYASSLRAAQTLAAAMVQAIRSRYAQQAMPEALIPVPLSYLNQVRRGYNQAAWLAHYIGKAIARPVLCERIKRRHGPAQHTLSRRRRLRMPVDEFDLPTRLPFSHVAIIDDVLTTGGTITALHKLLDGRGVTQVDIWVATRATPA